jgi:hypothetical protein
MFSKTDGPTALRTDLVRALSFSLDRVQRLSGGANVTSVAALAGVWNGRKGHVALLVRDVEPALIERYVGDGPISSEVELDAAVEEGLAFAESLGFSMDPPDFIVLSAEERDGRIHRWNKLRKVRSSSTTSSGTSAPYIPELDVPELPPIASGYDIGLDDLAIPAPSPARDLSVDFLHPAAPRDESPESIALEPNAGSTVLGKISLVRKGGADLRRLELIARLLAFY